MNMDTGSANSIATESRQRGSGLPSASIIIPTKNRAGDLVIAVESILRQLVLPAEVIVIDQSPDDEGRRQVQALFTDAPGAIRQRVQLCYIHDPGIAGAAVARNAGIERSTSEVLVFLDDDVILEPEFLERMLAVYRDYPSVDAVSGVVTNYVRPPLSSLALRTLFYRGPFDDERQRIYWNADRLRDSDPIPARKFGTGGMGIRRLSLGPVRFDSHLKGVPAGEDVDFCCRLGAACKLVIAPRSRYFHKRSPANRDRAHWLQTEVHAAYYLYLRNWRTGVKNRLCFAWLNVGFFAVCVAGCLRRRSLGPWRALRVGIRKGRSDGLSNQVG